MHHARAQTKIRFNVNVFVVSSPQLRPLSIREEG